MDSTHTYTEKEKFEQCFLFVSLFIQKAVFKVEHAGDPLKSSKKGGVRVLVAPKLLPCLGHREQGIDY